MRNLLLAISFMIPSLVFADGLNISIGQPGFYGQINLGDHYPVPQLIYPSPVVAIPPAVMVPQQRPLYLFVPPGHAKHWDKHCHRYNACSQPAYFVREDWYQKEYLPRYNQDRGRSGWKRNNASHDHLPGNHEAHPHTKRGDYRNRYDDNFRAERGNNGKNDKHIDREYKAHGKNDKHIDREYKARGNKHSEKGSRGN